MKPNSPQLDEHGFPIPPTFAGGADARGRAGRVGRYAWRTALVLAFLALLGTFAVREGVVDRTKEMLAHQLVRGALKRADQDDLPGALANLDRAVGWAPDEPNAYRWRALFRLETNDLQGSLADFNRLIELNGRFTPAYTGRSSVLQRLNRHREAIDDLTQAIKLSPEHDPAPRNNRAYARAIAGVELKEGLTDVELALALVQGELNAIPNVPNHPRTRLFLAERNQEKAMYLDTRATLRLLLGNHDEALRDMDEALGLVEDYIRVRSPFDPSPRFRRLLDQELGVMYHHRGQIHQMLGHTDQAQLDLKKGQELGYNPAGGVY
jgi:tetratricopeptide (TPR) repeat protein